MKKKLKNQNFGSFWPIFDFELKRKMSRAEPSQAKPSWAESSSAWATDLASSARTHHYTKYLPLCANVIKVWPLISFFRVIYYVAIKSIFKNNLGRMHLHFLFSSKSAARTYSLNRTDKSKGLSLKRSDLKIHFFTNFIS